MAALKTVMALSPDPAVGTCFHCGENLPASPVRVMFDGAERALCCPGCAAAAAWIHDAGLHDYYRLRTEDGRRVDADADDFSVWDRDDVQAGHIRERDGVREITVLIEGMRCAACAWLIGRALTRLPGVVEAEASAITGRLHLRWQPDKLALSAILARLSSLGYRPHLATGEQAEAARKAERRDLLKRMAVAGIGAFQAMMFAEALYLDFHSTMPEATRDFFRWITFLVSTPVVFYAGWPFIAGMIRELQHRRFGMDTLIASSVLLAHVASLIETIRGGPHVWFDAAVMFVLFLLIARFLERMARLKAQAGVDALARARPALAWREDADGKVDQVPRHALVVGDIVRVPAGEALPADGVVLDTSVELVEALITGESLPVLRHPGESVWAGSLTTTRPLRLRIERTGQDTLLSDLVRRTEQAQSQRPKLARVADAIASRFVLTLFAVAAVVAIVWSQTVPERAVEVTLAVLIVSCPCALSLALPAAIATAHARLARMGVLVLDDEALSTLARVDTVVFDKTGTLTTGRLSVRSVQALAGSAIDATQARRIAAALEQGSHHPLAQAFALPGVSAAGDIVVVPGRGVEGVVEGCRWWLGRPGFASGRPDCDEDAAGVWLGDGERLLARFDLVDPMRGDAGAAVSALQAQDIALEVLSGDSHQAVSDAAGALGLRNWRARQMPDDKLARVRELQQQGHVVAMLGDGINDAPVLAGADVSLAIAGGAPLAHRAAGIVLMGESLSRVPESIALAGRTRAVMRQNLAWALGYNVLALPFAAAGLVAPWLAALGMALSSLLVTGNALRVARVASDDSASALQSGIAPADSGRPAAAAAGTDAAVTAPALSAP